MQTYPLSSMVGVQTYDVHWHGNLIEVKDTGEVLISWKNVEATIADPKSDRWALAYARMLVAARDGTAKPLPDEAH